MHLSEALQLAQQALAAGNRARARSIFWQVLEVAPEEPHALHGLAYVAHLDGEQQQAENYVRAALARAPREAAFHNTLNLILQKQGRLPEAAEACRTAISLAPTLPELHNNLGVVLSDLGQMDKSLASFAQALQLRPHYADAHYNRGNALVKLHRLEEAEAAFQDALAYAPNDHATLNNLGSLWQRIGKLDQAGQAFERAIALAPHSAEAHRNRALLWLLLGDFERGWPEYRWRTRMPTFAWPPHAQPVWEGQPLAGERVLIWAEQGFGDAIQFIRYAALVKAAAASRVLFECSPRLHALLRGMPGLDALVAPGAHCEPFDYQVPLFDLPAVFGTTLETIPAAHGYLQADAKLKAAWAQRLAGESGFKIGIAWQGNPEFAGDHYRSIPLAQFAPLAECPGVRLYGLQKGTGREQLPLAASWGLIDLAPQLDGGADAFMDTAAVMAHLDLVITSDTAIAHLAGALGVPVWVALQQVPNWRWLLDRGHCPWYASMRLFRQQRFGAWEDVFAAMARELRQRTSSTG